MNQIKNQYDLADTFDYGNAYSVFENHKANELSKKQLTRLRHIWGHMWARCTKPTDQAFSNYGAKGIAVTELSWAVFYNFAMWAVDNGYQDNLTIDREKGELGYNADNCRWITKADNCRNRPNFNYHLPDGRLCIDVAKSNGIKNTTWIMRIKKGWDRLDAVTTPVNKKPKELSLA